MRTEMSKCKIEVFGSRVMLSTELSINRYDLSDIINSLRYEIDSMSSPIMIDFDRMKFNSKDDGVDFVIELQRLANEMNIYLILKDDHNSYYEKCKYLELDIPRVKKA